MKKWIYLGALTLLLLVGDYFFGVPLKLHASFTLTTLFLAALTFVFFRLEDWAPKEWQAQVSLLKVALRLLLSLGFILVLIYTQDDLMNMVIQFIVLYLIFMVFEIVVSLTNLRGN